MSCRLVPPSDIRVRIAPDANAVAIRVGVVNGMATAIIGVKELRTAAIEAGRRVRLARPAGTAPASFALIGPPPGPDPELRMTEWPLSNGNLRRPCRRRAPASHDARPADAAVAAADVDRGGDHHLAAGQPAADPAAEAAGARRSRITVPAKAARPAGKLGPSEEIQELRDAFARAIAQVEESERETTARWRANAGWSARSIIG